MLELHSFDLRPLLGFHKFDRITGVGEGGLRGCGAVINSGSSGGKEGRQLLGD